MARFPSPDEPHPVLLPDGTRLTMNVFLKAVIDHPCIEIGDYSYASDFDPPEEVTLWSSRLAPYLFPDARDRLVIGKFCQIAHGVRFITNGANHKMDGFSTFPFAIHTPERMAGCSATLPAGSDTNIGHDVWIGMDAKIMPGARIGNGVIIGAGAVVSGNIPDYAVVAGNRAKIVKMRFDCDTIATLNKIAWWNWTIDQILDHEETIVSADIVALQTISERIQEGRP